MREGGEEERTREYIYMYYILYIENKRSNSKIVEKIRVGDEEETRREDQEKQKRRKNRIGMKKIG